MLRLVLIFCITFLMVMQAGADPRHFGGGGGWNSGWHGGERWHGGYRYREYSPGVWRRYDPALGGFIGGMIGGWLWRQWAQPEPVEPVRDMEWCINRYKSYDPYTKTYLGYDGLRHGCP